MISLRAVALPVLVVLSGACAGLTGAPQETPFTLVLIKTGPRTEALGKEEQARVFGGHFANMERLGREGRLLVAGPFGADRSDPTLRGIFVLDTADLAEARTLAETDPGFQAGVFRFEYHTIATAAPLRAHRAAEAARLDAAEKAGAKPEPGAWGRPFALITAEEGQTARAVLADHPGVLLSARLDGARAWFLFDAKDAAAARMQLAPVADRAGPLAIDDWFGSRSLVELRER